MIQPVTVAVHPRWSTMPPMEKVYLQEKGVLEHTWFHVSDEPGMNDIGSYRSAVLCIRGDWVTAEFWMLFAVTDTGESFHSGDAFLVYQGPEGQPFSSIRLEVLREAMEDLRVLLRFYLLTIMVM